MFCTAKNCRLDGPGAQIQMMTKVMLNLVAVGAMRAVMAMLRRWHCHKYLQSRAPRQQLLSMRGPAAPRKHMNHLLYRYGCAAWLNPAHLDSGWPLASLNTRRSEMRTSAASSFAPACTERCVKVGHCAASAFESLSCTEMRTPQPAALRLPVGSTVQMSAVHLCQHLKRCSCSPVSGTCRKTKQISLRAGSSQHHCRSSRCSTLPLGARALATSAHNSGTLLVRFRPVHQPKQ